MPGISGWWIRVKVRWALAGGGGGCDSVFTPCSIAVFPNSCSISLVAMGNRYEWESKVQYWNNVYGMCTYMCACVSVHVCLNSCSAS